MDNRNSLANILASLNKDQTNAFGGVESILSSRPSLQDDANAMFANMTSNSYVSPQAMSDQRLMENFKKLSAVAEFQKMNKPDLPTGYQMNNQTGQAELIPGVDESFSRKSDPYALPMPVMLNGQPTFARKGDVMRNPSGFQPVPTEGQGNFKRENTVRDEFNTLTKDFRTVQDAYSKIKGTSDSGAGDMSMLYSYVKLLDPGSVVRESEFATAAASGSYGERVAGAVKSITQGGRLPPSLRKEFLDEAGRIYGAQKGGYDRTKQTYTGIAQQYGLDPRNVITDYTEQPQKTVVKTQSSPSNPNLKKIIYSDGTEEIINANQ